MSETADFTVFLSVRLPAIQSETWLVRKQVHEPCVNPQQVREPRVNPLGHVNFLRLIPVFKGKSTKIHMNGGFRRGSRNLPVNQPCLRLDCTKRY